MLSTLKWKEMLKIEPTSWRLWLLVVIISMAVVAVGSMLVQFALMMMYGENFLSHTKLLFVGEMFAKVLMIVLGIVLVFVFAKGDKRRAIGLTRTKLSQIIIWGVLSALLFNVFMYGWEALIPGAKEDLEGALQKMGFGKTMVGDSAFIFTIVVLAPIGEEILFRGIAFRALFSGLSKFTKIGLGWALLIATVLVSYQFGSIHMGEGKAFYFIIPYFVLALVFTYVYVATGSLYTAIISHSVNNSFVILIALLTFTKLQASTNLVYLLILSGPFIAYGVTYMSEKMFFQKHIK